jgi:lysophospholipase L1-like esterase
VFKKDRKCEKVKFYSQLLITVLGLLIVFALSGCGGGGGGEGATTSNIKPVADAGADRVVLEGSEVMLDGSLSNDEDGRIASYNWAQLEGTTVSLIDTNTANPRFTAPETGLGETLRFQLTVQDDDGAQSLTDEVAITVNVEPVADAGTDQSLAVHNPDTHPITLSGTSSDVDGTIETHQWLQIDGPDVADLTGADTPTITFNVPAETQSYTFSYTVTDNHGAQQTDTISVYTAKIIFSDSFADTSKWTPVDDTGDGILWYLDRGELRQQNSALALQDSYQLGTYAVLSSASLNGETSYRFSVDLTPLQNNIEGETEGNDVGIMFRYLDEQNYYRLSMNARNGYSRLEKRVGGNFFTLAVNAIGYIDGQAMTITAESNGSTIIIWIDGDPVFSVVDSSISSGTVALYCQDKAKFDNVQITENPLQPTVVISTPLAYSIALTREAGDTLTAEAVVLNPPIGGNVVFSMDDGGDTDGTPSGSVYSAQFAGVADGEHDILAILEDANGQEVSSDINSTVGTGGDYYIALGDSITRGFGDDDDSNNDSADGRIVSIQGFQAPLADDLTSTSNRPQIVFNEGIGGLEASELLDRLDSILERHPGANKAILLIGTNDSNSGVSQNDFADSVEAIAEKIDDIHGKQVWLAKVLPAYIQPAPPWNLDTTRNAVIAQYNTKIQDIATADFNDGTFLGPNFYTIFNDTSLYKDYLHPNDLGYQAMADGWHDILTTP